MTKTFPPSEQVTLAVDIVILSAIEGHLNALLLRREREPEKGRWALSGAFLKQGESLEDCADRVLKDKLGIKGIYLEQLYTFALPKRDPRGRVVSVAYFALVEGDQLLAAIDHKPDLGLAKVEVPWSGELGGPVKARLGGKLVRLAFDHKHILGMAVKRIRGKLGYVPIGYRLLPKEFSLLQLQKVHETILGRALNKDSFRRKMLASGELEATGKMESGAGHRPARLYRHIERAVT